MELNSTSGVTLGFAFAVLVVAAAPVNAASITGLGDLVGGSFRSSARAISEDGTVVVGRSDSAAGSEAFRWTRAGGMAGLGDFPDGTFDSTAYGVSANGAVVVGQGQTTSGSAAFLWAAPGAIVPLHADALIARGTSADVSVVVGRGTGTEAFVWSAGGGVQLLGLLGGVGDGFVSDALAVSADGQVVVGQATSLTGREAFRWTLPGGMVSLGTWPQGSACAVSSDGSVIVGNANSSFGREAFRWTAAGGMVGLGDLDGGGFSSVACGVSSDGSVVVGWGETATGNAAFIWDAAHGMRDLRFVLADDFNVNPNGWVLETARCISADGSMIVGQGKNPAGDTEAWLVDLNAVPKPVLSVPADITIECGTSTDPANTGIATASGTCSAGVTVSVVDQVSAGDCGAEFVITRTWTVADLCGNSVTDHQTITSRDTTAPTLVVPADRIVACGETTEPTNTGIPTVTDACGGKVTITFSDALAAGACGGISVITRTWAVTDACGNSSSLDQTITVEQPTTPVVTGLAPPPDWVVNRASSIGRITVHFDRPATVDSFAIRGVNTGPVAGVLTGNGTDTHTLVLETPLPNGDRYTAIIIANQVLAEWSFAVLIGDCDRNERVDIFDLARMRSALRNGAFDEGCDIQEDGVINIFDLGRFRRALQEGIALP